MGRPAVINQDKIREAIKALEAEKKEVNAIVVRERLGSGSYSTIAAVLAAWRREQAAAVRPIIPEMPDALTHLLRHLWEEAWRAADSVHQSERESREREKTQHEKLEAEMGQEITRLEEELSRVGAERQAAKASAAKAKEELEQERVERAKAIATVQTLQAELTELRGESRKALETVTAWVERATRAEARLGELAKGAGEGQV